MAANLEGLTDWVVAGLAAEAPLPDICGALAPDLTVPDAYRIQTLRMERAVAKGDVIAGYKAALTSKAMQEREGLNEPILGTLLASRHHEEGAPVSLRGYLRATLEPEVGVVLGADLAGPGVTTISARAAIAGYLPAIEIGDLRGAPGPRTIQHTIVCNTFNGGHLFGQPLTAPAGIDLRREGMVLTLNGAVRGSATAVEVLGDPLRSVAFMANKLAEQGLALKAGMVLLTGSIVASIDVAPNDHAQVAFTRLGEVEVRFQE